MAINIHWPEVADMYFEDVIGKHGILDVFVTYHGKAFCSRFCNRVSSHWRINHSLSTSFQPQTTGRREQQSQTMERYLWAFSNKKQDNWVELLHLAEFAYNNSVHHSMGMTRICANHHHHLPIQLQQLKAPSNSRSEILPDSMVLGITKTHQLFLEDMLEA